MSIYADQGVVVNSVMSEGINILEILLIVFIGLILISIVFSVIMIIAQWKIFAKAGRPGWYSLIPFYNTWVLFELAKIPGWLSLIPTVNIIAVYYVYYKLAELFGRSIIFRILTMIFPMICLPIIAFSKNIYSGNNNMNSNFTSNQQGQFSNQFESSTIKVCPTCKKNNPSTSMFCGECGTRL